MRSGCDWQCQSVSQSASAATDGRTLTNGRGSKLVPAWSCHDDTMSLARQVYSISTWAHLALDRPVQHSALTDWRTPRQGRAGSFRCGGGGVSRPPATQAPCKHWFSLADGAASRWPTLKRTSTLWTLLIQQYTAVSAQQIKTVTITRWKSSRLWNSLPLNCRTAPSVNTFKIRLQRFLFDSA